MSIKKNVFRHFTIILLLTLVLIVNLSCGPSRSKTFNTKFPELSKTSAKRVKFDYNPGDREEFVFPKSDDESHTFTLGYDGFCKNPRNPLSCKRLSYSNYVGIRGYFVHDEPVFIEPIYYAYKVVLQNGEEYYFITTKRGRKYGILSDIMPYEKYKKLRSFSKEPIFKGSELVITSVRIKYGSKYFVLSNGLEIREEKLYLIQKIASKYGTKGAAIAEILFDCYIIEDEVDKEFFIYPGGTIYSGGFGLYIKLKNKTPLYMLKIRYDSDEWLFVRSYKIAADDYRWQSPNYRFNRDHSSRGVWEWINIPVRRKEILLAKKICNAKKTIIRFQGEHYYRDSVLSDEQKNGIKKIIKLFNLLNKKS